MLSIEDVKQISFRRAGFGGYRPEEVDAFIDQVLITMEQMKKEKSDLVKKMDILATRVEEYRADEDAVRNAMLASQRVADSTIKAAKAKAAQMVEESENAAKAKLYDLNMQIKEQKKQYSHLLLEANRIREEIITNCNKHIIVARELPSQSRIESLERQINEKYPTESVDEEIERAEEIMAPGIDPELAKTAQRPSQVVADNFDVVPNSVNTEKSEAVESPEDEPEAAPTPHREVYTIDDIDPIPVSETTDSQDKKGKQFGSLKFGDDYDINDDEN